MNAVETAPLVEGNRPRDVKKFFLLLALFASPFAASQIAIYDLLFDVARGSHHPAEKVGSLLSSVAVMNGVITMIVSIVLNTYTDRAGRKQGLIWFMGLTSLGVLFFPICAYILPHKWDLWRMMAPYFLMALGGSPSVMLNLSVLYITDLLPNPRLRTEYLSFLIGIVMSVQAIAPGLGGAMLKSGVHLAPYFYGCTVFMAISTFAFYWFAKSDVPDEQADVQDSPKSLQRAVELATFKHCETPALRRNALIVFVNFLVSNMCAVGFLDLIMVYAKQSFKWTGSNVGANMFELFSIRTLWAVLGFPLLYARLTTYWPASSKTVDIADSVHMFACNILTVAGYLALGFAQTSSQYSHGLAVLANDAIVGPVWINALLKHVDPAHKGEFMAALSVIGKPVEAFLPALMMKILTATLTSWPQCVFFVAAGIILLLLVSQFFIKPIRT